MRNRLKIEDVLRSWWIKATSIAMIPLPIPTPGTAAEPKMFGLCHAVLGHWRCAWSEEARRWEPVASVDPEDVRRIQETLGATGAAYDLIEFPVNEYMEIFRIAISMPAFGVAEHGGSSHE